MNFGSLIKDINLKYKHWHQNINWHDDTDLIKIQNILLDIIHKYPDNIINYIFNHIIDVPFFSSFLNRHLLLLNYQFIKDKVNQFNWGLITHPICGISNTDLFNNSQKFWQCFNIYLIYGKSTKHYKKIFTKEAIKTFYKNKYYEKIPNWFKLKYPQYFTNEFIKTLASI